MRAAASVRISRRLLTGSPDEVAPSLLGAILSSTSDEGRVAIRITEVEAYGAVGEDAASHAHNGPTRRNAVMFERPGLLYVYFIYGMHWCANVVCGPQGVGSAILLRAGDVIAGIDVARRRRPTRTSDASLARGPANLAVALGITGSDNGVDLLSRASNVRLTSSSVPVAASDIASGQRIGIRREADRRWRWWLTSAPSVSRTPKVQPHTPR
ncbi:MAG TPA: DNA-3-methyladenine glycosylase [Actinomycetes bacterium]|nr:DNA-3-methyladenine glycosylase [Actinomycetes bacterium]